MPTPPPPDTSFVIAGLGASAGGLEAFEQFFRRMPSGSGVAFVLVQHLDPIHVSMLTEILQRCSPLPMVEAEDQMAVEPDHVYIIPPNRDMTIINGVLHLSAREDPRGHWLPIDDFLTSLAHDQGKYAFGIILSGTGTDGTAGLGEIIAAGGVTFVQKPDTAKYAGMPESAIKAGFASQILPVEDMPQALLLTASNLLGERVRKATAAANRLTSDGLKRLLILLRTATGYDFSLYKKSTVSRRIERHMASLAITDIDAYTAYLKEHPEEVRTLFTPLLINVTSFFRDPDAFATLKQDILPSLCAGKPEDYIFRVWVAGCASGEEAYSIAILLSEFMEEAKLHFKAQIYSTDLDDEAIAFARRGHYPAAIAANISAERLSRFFVKTDVGYRIATDIREMVVFAVQSVISDPPFTKLDLLSCRHLMIYLEPELQNRVIPVLHYALKPGGVLFLAPSEGLGRHANLFVPLSRKWKFFRAVRSSAPFVAPLMGSLQAAAKPVEKGPSEANAMKEEPDYAGISRRLLLESYAPASVVADAQGNILYVHGETDKYLRLLPGYPTLNLFEMARDGLEPPLRAACKAAIAGTSTIGREVPVTSDGQRHAVSLSVRPLPHAGGAGGLILVSFQDIARPLPTKRRRPLLGLADAGRIDELERDLAYTKENLHATIEEQQASSEELKSANEELQSTNEELQSTNEELETSKEELQSVNEELQSVNEEMMTVNSELQTKIKQLVDSQNDVKNLLDNIPVGAVFLDRHLLIRRFTREATQIFRLAATDIGRPLADIRSNLQGDELVGAAEAVLESLVPTDQPVRTNNGAAYLARIQPYRTLDNVIDGVVLTFADISQRIAAEQAEHAARLLAEGIIDTVRDPLLVLDAAMIVISASQPFYSHFGVTPEQTVGKRIYDLGNRQWDIPALRELLETILPRHETFENFIVEHDFPTIGLRKMRLTARRIATGTPARPLILLAIDPGSA
jgi:two-component system CheB/CheR fusion protein